jgi:hypothetical protein
LTREPTSYRFGPIEHHGLLGPIRLGQAIVIGSALASAVGFLDTVGGVPGVVLAVASIAAAGTLATLPVAGRTGEQWMPVVWAFTLRGASGRRRFRSPAPMRGVTHTNPDPDLPERMSGLKLVTIEHGARRLGAFSERRGRLLTAVLACRSLSFALLDPEAQERRLAQWGSLLAASASSPLKRVQWIERTAPAQGDELARWLSSARDPGLPPRGAPIVESYLELLSQSTRVRHDHEILLAIQIDTSRVRDRSGVQADQIVEQIGQIARSLESAEIKVLGALGVNQLAHVVRTAFDPYARAELAAREALDSGQEGRAAGLPLHDAPPLGAQESWDHYRCDGAFHATFWISEWPRTGVSPMFMDPLLGASGAVRTVAVTFEPVSPERSVREAEAAITQDRADSELRRRGGQSETARQRQAQEAAARREAELAAGHGEVRLAGFVTVSGRDERELRRACAEIHTHAARARLALHRMYGQQAEAFTFTLPLARGLR